MPESSVSCTASAAGDMMAARKMMPMPIKDGTEPSNSSIAFFDLCWKVTGNDQVDQIVAKHH